MGYGIRHDGLASFKTLGGWMTFQPTQNASQDSTLNHLKVISRREYSALTPASFGNRKFLVFWFDPAQVRLAQFEAAR